MPVRSTPPEPMRPSISIDDTFSCLTVWLWRRDTGRRILAIMSIVALCIPLEKIGTEEPSLSDRQQTSITLTFEERYERFQLFNYCLPMGIVVENLNENAEGIGLHQSTLSAAVESRLRSARLFDNDAQNYLYLNVLVSGRAFSINLEFNKTLYDSSSGYSFRATTWHVGSTGTHGKDTGFIINGVSRHMDEFLLEYLRVNEDHCV